jgi:hypothetical protein
MNVNAIVAERMSRPLRGVTYFVFGLLWVSGCGWLILHEFFPRSSDFGPSANPWEPVVLRLHGWLAVAGTFLLGWISAQHIAGRWARFRTRPSGPVLAGLAAVLVLTGYALYYTTDSVHASASVTHEILGAAAVLLALGHWRRNGAGAARRT